MMVGILVAFGILAAATVVSEAADPGPLPAPYTEHCIIGEKNLYPPSNDTKVPWFTVNLDENATTRWNHIAAHYKDDIISLIDVIKGLTKPFFNGSLINWVDTHMGGWDGKLKEPYNEELKGIAATLDIPLGEVVLYNVFYELFTVCTSIIAEDDKGTMYHARNLDFGLFLGWDYNTHDWMVTEVLRNMIVNVNFMKGGKSLYKSTNFAGYVGVFTGMKPNMFTITMNERFDLLDGGYQGIIGFLMGEPTNFVTFFIREVFEGCNSYEEAIEKIASTELAAPAYFIVGGTKPSQASIVTRSREGVLGNATMDGNKWFLLETNYDLWKDPLFLDDRRSPGNQCMKNLGMKGVGFAGIFNVLSSKTNLNKLTAYTALMEVASGRYETYKQACPDPCWPF